jgi:hypothetical protein
MRGHTDTCTFSKIDSLVHGYGADVATFCGTSTEKEKPKSNTIRRHPMRGVFCLRPSR